MNSLSEQYLVLSQGTDVTYRPIDQLQMPRRPTSLGYPASRFKVWLSVLKFDLAPRFGFVEEPANVLLQQPEDCEGMLRIWDGPLRDPPSCSDYNWYVALQYFYLHKYLFCPV